MLCAMRTLLIACVAVGLAAVCGRYAVHAQNRPAGGEYTVYGDGAEPCWKLDTRPRSFGSVEQRSWVVGFVSGYGYAHGRLKKVDVAALTAFVDSYCRAHPRDDIAKATEALVEELARP